VRKEEGALPKKLSFLGTAILVGAGTKIQAGQVKKERKTSILGPRRVSLSWDGGNETGTGVDGGWRGERGRVNVSGPGAPLLRCEKALGERPGSSLIPLRGGRTWESSEAFGDYDTGRQGAFQRVGPAAARGVGSPREGNQDKSMTFIGTLQAAGTMEQKKGV